VAEVHHQDAIGDVLDHVQVVRDEDVRQRQLGLEILEQVEDLGLDGLVERRDGLVEHEELGIEHERARDVHPLALASRQFVRVARAVEPGIEADALEEAPGAGARLAAGRAVHEQAERHRVVDRHARIQRGVRVLKDELHVPAQPLQARPARRAQILAEERDGARIGLEQAENQPGQGRLAAPGFADDAQRLLRLHGERDVVHRPHPRLRPEEKAAADGKVLAEPAGREDGPAQTRTSIASRSPSERRLKAIEVRKIATPGSAGTQALT
jgi:hypothetical protein